MKYQVQSLDGRTNTWATIYEPTSLKQARKDAKEWRAGVLERRKAGKVHHSIGVRIVKPGDQGEPFLSQIWGHS